MAYHTIHPPTRPRDALMSSARSTRRPAFTLVELLLSLAVVGVVGLGVMFMLAGTSAAARTQNDARMNVTRQQVASARLSTLTRANAMILAAGPGYLVFWKGDVNGNSKPDLAELRRLEWDSQAREVWVSEAPPSLDPASNTAYELNHPFATTTQALAGSVLFPTSVILQNIATWEVTLDKADPQAARLMKLKVHLGDLPVDQAVIVISALRASTQ